MPLLTVQLNLSPVHTNRRRSAVAQ